MHKYDPVRRFWGKVDTSGSCWIWQGRPRTEGYGVIYINGQLVYAHRQAWILARGPIPEGAQVRHLCRDRLCVRPDHLCLIVKHPIHSYSAGSASAHREHVAALP